jgi:glycerophosphoryl diester phosphodiesterase
MNAWRTLDGHPPWIIAHRGASGHLPEHVLEAYGMALAHGADALEPDVLPDRDGVLWVRHDLGLSHSTDVTARPEFAARVRERFGTRDWWIDDFDAAELGALRAVQPRAGRDRAHDGLYPLLRFETLLDFVQAQRDAGRPSWLCPELKHAEVFREHGFDPLRLLLDALQPRGLAGPDAPVLLHCFDHAALREAHDRAGMRCVALYERFVAPAAWPDTLHELATWAEGIAPEWRQFWDGEGHDRGLVAAAHAAGLRVHAWTFRDDAPSAPFASPRKALNAAFALGIDALFCDFPDTAVAARAVFAAG